ncbi:methyl-accepting chemotaxis protein [Cohnella nanjingensis]|uniref:HAMP domain-containing protein n=1 Tax=Cohnella nanjingensis TaxID=1387779 RepID=A0A7X0VFN2_9BACL|nr:methyl-accepting chemotaxis protein [Cohnella nanjingensis]MBB6672217.1 HAMP domain-containing protein [Cohnella nanjingensis]
MFRFNSRLVLKLSLSILALLVLLSSVLIVMQIRNTKKASEEAIGSFNMHMAEAYAGQFDLKSYADFLKNATETDLYWNLREELNLYRQRIGAMYVYTVRIDGDKKPILLIDGQPRSSDSASPIGEVTDMPEQAIEAILDGQPAKTSVIRNPEYGDYLSSYAPLRDADGKVIGALGIDTNVSVANSIYRDVIRNSMPLFVLMGILTLLIFILIVWFMSRALRPLGVIVKGAEAIARGDLADAKAHLGAKRVRSKDEIGQAYSAMIRMTERLGVTLGDVVRDMADTTQSLVRSTNQFGSESERMVAMNESLEQSAAELADGAKHQRIGAEESAKSVGEMAAAIGRIAEASASVTEVSGEALASAERGRNAIGWLREQVASMSDAARQTTESVQVLEACMQEIEPALAAVTGISDQTKLLALNASIEAARAAEHGAGFAIVAGEVRKLADASAVAVKHIAELLLQIKQESVRIGERMREEGQEINRGEELSGQAERLFNLAMDRFVLVNGQIQEISAASEEVLAGSEEVSASVEQISRISRQAEDSTEALRAMSARQLEAAKRIADTTELLRERSSGLEAAVGKFKL